MVLVKFGEYTPYHLSLIVVACRYLYYKEQGVLRTLKRQTTFEHFLAFSPRSEAEGRGGGRRRRRQSRSCRATERVLVASRAAHTTVAACTQESEEYALFESCTHRLRQTQRVSN